MCEEKLYHEIFFDELIQEHDKREDEPIARIESPFFHEGGLALSDYARNTATWD